ncbi:MAG: flippase [Candidatus Undinarchaeales archaeon]
MNSEEKDEALKVFAKGAGISFFGLAFGAGIAYLYRLLIARLFGPSDYGLFSLGISVFAIGTTVAKMGLPQGVARFVAFYKGKKDKPRLKGTLTSGYKLTLITGTLIGIILFILSDWLSIFVFNNPGFSSILKAFSIAIPFNAFLIVTVGGMRGFQKLKYKVYSYDIFHHSMILILILVAFWLGFGILGASIGYALSFIFSACVAFYLLNNKIFSVFNKKIKSKPVYKNLLNFSVPLMFASVLLSLIGKLDTLMLGIFSTSAQVGIYNAAFPTAFLLTLVLGSTEMIFMPMSSEMLAKNLMDEIRSVFHVVTKWMFSITFPLLLLMVFFSRPLLRILFGAEYVSGAAALSILAAGYFVASAVGPTGATLQTLGKTKIFLMNNIVVLGINVALNLYLIPLYGIVGAATATAVSFALWNLLTLFEVYYFSKIQPFRFVFLKPTLAASISILAVYYLAKILHARTIFSLTPLLLLFLLLYFVLFLLFKGFEEEDIMILITIEKRLGLDLKLLKNLFKKFL